MTYYTSVPAPSEQTLRPLVFLDFEACALSRASWPVEIGYSWIADGQVWTRSRLIAPRPDWPLSEWSEVSARVHGIPLDDLWSAPSADEVAADTDWLAGCEVISENPAWEQLWLDRLREGRGPRIEVSSLRKALRERLDEGAASAVVQSLFRSNAPHRAGPDAERLARAWFDATVALGIAA